MAPVLHIVDAPGSYRSSKAIAAGLFCALNVQRSDALLTSDLSPLGGSALVYPYMRINGEIVVGDNACARFLASSARNALVPPAPMGQQAAARMAEIDAVIDASASMLAPPALAMHDNMLSGAFDAAMCARCRDALLVNLKATDEGLKTKTFLCGDAITLADVVVCVDVFPAFAHAFTEADRKRVPNVTRWFTTVVNHPHFAKVLGGAPKTPKALAALPTRKLQEAAAPAKADKAAAKKPAGEKKGGGGAEQKKKGGGGAEQKKKGGGADAKKAGGSNQPSSGGGVDIPKTVEQFGEWFSQVCTKGELIEYYDVSGCYILRPWSYTIWEHIKDFFDAEIKKLGVQNCYFPMFVTKDVLEKEKDHVEGFAPEVAWVTKSGESDLEVPLAIRPTSETVMYPVFAKWIRSHRDLPLKLNQWCNVVRWEFKHPTPFIRTREFLWQEGHTAHANKKSADDEVITILKLYARIYEELLACPVIQGVKSEKEKFAGGLYTTTVEAFIPTTGKGVQGGTSHNLGQNFAKMFNIEFESEEKGASKGQKNLVWQNSWGLTTRTIGVMIMVHGDDNGLVVPPRVAPHQIVIVTIPNSKMSKEELDAMDAAAEKLSGDLEAPGAEPANPFNAIRSKTDLRSNYTPGWKYNYWEMRGVPIRCEIGPKDMANKACVFVRRDTREKTFCSWSEAKATATALLAKMQAEMLERARKQTQEQCCTVTKWEDFVPALDNRCMVLTPWHESVEVEELVKTKSSAESDGGAAKTLCIPFNQPPLPAGTPCFVSGKPATKWALWGRSY
ncbi:hypothetical protein PPROV_000026800 [Pycnococcus provasolii]|uniref:proline--tRNA ligase n=2 Tax=Pycnococcus provasolii TaxID=41880 RepID=A0A830H4Q4_9CHLO|nr:hypothetical protein PPROV_000026800 [Pycnococcus provasolii]